MKTAIGIILLAGLLASGCAPPTGMDRLFTAEEKQTVLMEHGRELLAQGTAENDHVKIERARMIFAYLEKNYGVQDTGEYRQEEDAGKYVQEIEELQSQEVNPLAVRAREAMARNDIQEATVAWRRLAEQEPGNPAAEQFFKDHGDEIRATINDLLDRGVRALADGDFEMSRESYEAVLAMDPENVEAREGLAAIEEQRREKSARLFALGLEKIEQNDFDSARKAFVQAQELGYDEAQVASRLDEIDRMSSAEYLYEEMTRLAEEGEYLKARNVARKLLVMDPEYRDARKRAEAIDSRVGEILENWYQQGRTLFNAKDYAMAMQMFERIVAYDEEYQDVQDYMNRCRAILEVMDES
jgi:tetratricopeptide (TPR) repeat protein